MGAAPREPGDVTAQREVGTDDWFDVVVDGERISAATQPEQAACLLRDLAVAATAVLEGRTRKALVPLAEAPWELCLVGADATILVSLYRTGPLPDVRLLDRPVDAAALASQARVVALQVAPRVDAAFARELETLVDRFIVAARDPRAVARPTPTETLVRWRSRSDGRPVRLAFETVLAADGVDERGAVRADLHALLFRGRLTFDVRGQRAELAPGFVFLHLERLLSLCRPLLEAWSARRPLHLRVAAGASMLGLRLGTDESLALSIARPDCATFTAPALSPLDFALPVIESALALAQGVVRCDRGRARNLRLRALRAEARTLKRMVSALARTEAKINDDPAPYRASAVPAAPREAGRAGMDLSSAARLRYALRWRAEIEGIDLGGTSLCGDRLIVPGARELMALDRRSGSRLWSKALPRAATTLAGAEILRLTSRGDVELRDPGDGEVLWSSRVAPRVGAPATAFPVNVTGLPRLVVLAEGERRLVALDQRTGEPRWRYSARHGGGFRLRRVGRLLVVTSGDAAVTAIDVTTGDVVWRYAGGTPFALAPAVHRDVVAAISGEPGRGRARLFGIDAFTGVERWRAEHASSIASAPVGAANVVAVALASAEGLALVGHDVADGRERFRVGLGAGTSGAASLAAFDDLLVANLPSGRVVAVDATTGEQRWTRVLAAPVADDIPRRLDVQLRAGALFVPQSSLAVLRPKDGAAIANVEACDLVPDVLRIDEECALYVAEESGHVGCYELGARLSVVRAV